MSVTDRPSPTIGRAAYAAGWLRRNIYLVLGILIVGAFIVVAVFAETLAPYGADEQNLLAALEAPSAEHPVGTDALGRDLLSRVLIGTRHTLTVALTSVAIAVTAGITLGLVSGFVRGWPGRVIDAVVDIALTIPMMVLAIAIAAVMGAGTVGLIVAISISFTPPIARILRGRVLEIREEDYVDAAVTLGVPAWKIMVRHVLPNASTIVVIEASLQAGQAVLVATALGFLGLGVQPPTPEWGTLLGQGREYLQVAPYIMLSPGIAISLLVLGFNLLGDGLRDWLDPRLSA